jgi:hypothetical protein
MNLKETKLGQNVNSPLNPLKGKLNFKTVQKKLEIKIK